MDEKITIFCYGGCGRSVTVRKKKIQEANYYLCNSKVDGRICESKLPSLDREHGYVRHVYMNTAASFWGYRDAVATAEEAKSVNRAKEILAAGITQKIISDLMNKPLNSEGGQL
jgi:hypothetical protein